MIATKVIINYRDEILYKHTYKSSNQLFLGLEYLDHKLLQIISLKLTFL